MNTQEHIDEIMDCFDFKRVKTVMDAIQWEWTTLGGSFIPTEQELRAKARELLKQVSGEKLYKVGAGGFVATMNDDGSMELDFIIATWSTDND